MEDNVSGWSEEEELEESVQNLLDHLVIFLFRSKQVLQQLYQIRRSNCLGDLIVSADCSDQHHTLQDDIVFSRTVEQVVVKELYQVPLFDLLCPLVCWDVDHSSKKFEEKVSVLVGSLSELDVSVHVFFKRFNAARVELGDIPADLE